MSGKLWGTSNDGTIEFRSLTNEHLKDAIKVMIDGFFPNENVCKAIGLSKNPAAIEESSDLVAHTAKDGVSLIAIDKATNKVVGASINKLQVKENDPSDRYFEKFFNTCKQPESREMLDFMIKFDAQYDFYNELGVDCLVEIMFLGTLPECRGKGIAKKLAAITIQMAKELVNGVNVKQHLDVTQRLDLQPVPKVATAIYTSFISQKIGKDLGFQIVYQSDYSAYEYLGRNFTEVIKDTKFVTLEYLRI